MKQLGFYYDQTRCIGCQTCAVACKDWHDVPAGPAKWMRLSYREDGRYPDLFVSWVASPCYHCEQPVCSFACPNDAITKRESDGIVVVDREKCRGAKPCGIISEKAMGPDFLYGAAEAPCQVTCPAHLHIPTYAALIAKGKFKESLDLIRRRMPLPSVCGRVCLHPCETACTRGQVDKPIAIEALKRFVTDNVPFELPKRLPRTQPDKVAIVGSGPAGLAAAYDLIRIGYGVTVFESAPLAGGMLTYGIPEHRMPRPALKQDIDYIKALGVQIKTSTPIEARPGLEDLFKKGYGAIVLALGAQQGQKLEIPGANLKGVMLGTSFMRSVTTKEKMNIGKKVVVVGGGNVAIDCARSARRLGAKDVQVICLECRGKLPADLTEIKQAREEGVRINTSGTLTRVLGKAGKVTGIECLKVKRLRFTPEGRPQFNIVKDSEFTIPVDTVIFAIGQKPDLSCLSTECGVGASGRGTIVADPETMMTARRGIFSAGDAVNGPTNIIDAIASGQKAAFYVNRFLQGDVLRVRPNKQVKASDIKVDVPADVVKQRRQPMRSLAAATRVTNFDEVTLGYSAAAAMKEAERCLNCAGHRCKDACPYDAPQFAAETMAKMQKCDLCVERWGEGKKPICVEACIVRALDAGPLDELESKYGKAKDGYNFVYSPVTRPSTVIKPRQRKLA